MTKMHWSGITIIWGGFFSEDCDLVSRTVFKRDSYLFVEKSQKWEIRRSVIIYTLLITFYYWPYVSSNALSLGDLYKPVDDI